MDRGPGEEGGLVKRAEERLDSFRVYIANGSNRETREGKRLMVSLQEKERKKEK